MTLIDLQRRVAALKAGIGVDIRSDHLRFLAADHSDVPDLVTEAGQRALDPLLDGVDLLVVDNTSTLCRTGSDNDASSWTSMQEWILRLRRRGIAVPPNSFGNQRVARGTAVGASKTACHFLQVQSNESHLSRSYRSHLAFGTCSSTTFVSISNGTARRCSSST
jgi:hypothetical protein